MERANQHGRLIRVPSRVTLIALVLATVPLVWHGWAALHGFFTQDDFVFTHQAAHTPLSLDYVFQSYGGGSGSGGPHIMPAQFLLIWLVTRIAPGNYAVAVLPLLVMQAVATWVLWRLLSRLFPDNTARLVPFGVFTLSPVIFITSMWWAFGLQIVPFVLALFCAVHQHVRYLQTGRRRNARLALLATVGGLLFWEKAALIVPVLFAVSALLAPVDGLKDRVVWAARKHAAVWGAYAVVAIAYGALYFALAEPAQGEALRRGDVGQLAQTMVTHAFIPRLFGGPWDSNFAASSPAAVVLFTSLGAVAVVALGCIRGGTRAVLAWLALGGYVLADIVLLSAARLGFVGPVIGSDPRYVADAVPVAVILGALAFMRPSSTGEPSASSSPARGFVPFRWGVAVPAAVFTVGAIVSTALAIPPAQNREARSYAATLAAELRAHPTRALFDGGVPASVMLPVFGDEWRLSRVVGLSRPMTHLDATSDALFMADTDGLTRPFEFYFPTKSVPGPVYQCGHLAAPGKTEIPLERPIDQKHVVVRLDYFTGQPSSGTLQAGTSSTPVKFASGGVRTLYTVSDGPLNAVRVSTEFPVCVTQVLVGGPAPITK